MKYIILNILLCPLLLATSPSTNIGQIDAKFHMKTNISKEHWNALLVAMAHLKSRNDYTDEQRKLENYTVCIESNRDEITVEFLAVPRSGDEEVKGGNFSYALSVSYVLSSKTFRILKIYGSK